MLTALANRFEHSGLVAWESSFCSINTLDMMSPDLIFGIYLLDSMSAAKVFCCNIQIGYGFHLLHQKWAGFNDITRELKFIIRASKY